MSSQPTYLDSDPSAFDKKLKFVKNEIEEELEQLFGGSAESPEPNIPAPKLDYHIVTPKPGSCIKCFKVNTREKFFINLCQTDKILPPENISPERLNEILVSQSPSNFRIPMSISAPRQGKDKCGNYVDICDVAINPDFFKKCQHFVIFRDLLIAIILEAISKKYNIQLSADNWVVLKRKFIGNLISHRIQNSDMKKVYESYENTSKKDKKLFEEIYNTSSGRKLIQEITGKEAKHLDRKNDKSDLNTKGFINAIDLSTPQYQIFGKLKNSVLTEVIGEFFIPNCISVDEIALDIGADRILLESVKGGYFFDKFIPYNVDNKRVAATFNKVTKILTIQMPVIQS